MFGRRSNSFVVKLSEKNKIKYLIFISLFLFAFSSNFFAQTESTNITKAHPIIGWDSLQNIIERPENYWVMFRRANVTGSIYVSLIIDSSGTLVKVEPAMGYAYLSDSITYKTLTLVVEKVLSPIKWFPSYINNKPMNDTIYKYFNFLLIDEKGKGYNIIAPKDYRN